MSVCLAVAAVFFCAGLLQGLVGFGSALMAMPLLLFFMDVKLAVPLCIVDALALTLFMSYRLRGHVELRKVVPLLLGLPPGIVAGVLFLARAEGVVVMFALGVLILSYVGYALFLSPQPRVLHPAWGALAGFCSGAITAGLSGGGPPVIIYSSLAGWKRDQFKATLAVFFVVVDVFAIGGLATAGLLDAGLLRLVACSVPPVLLGAILGLKWAKHIPEKLFREVVLVLLGLLGLASCFKAIF